MDAFKTTDIVSVPAEKFCFADKRNIFQDKQLATKPRTYMQDAFFRFCKNKGAIVGAVIIILLFLYACFGALLTPYTVAYNDT